MLKKKLNPRGPKKRKLVTSLQTYGDGGKAGGQAQGRQGLSGAMGGAASPGTSGTRGAG